MVFNMIPLAFNTEEGFFETLAVEMLSEMACLGCSYVTVM